MSAVNAISFNPCVGLSPRIKISLPLLSICIDEIISTPKIITFLPTLTSGNENYVRVSYSIPQLLIPYTIYITTYTYTIYVYLYIATYPYTITTYLSGSVFFACLTLPNKQFLKAKSESKPLGHESNSWTMKIIYSVRRCISCTFFRFKQFPLNTKQKIKFSHYLIDGERLLSLLVGAVTTILVG